MVDDFIKGFDGIRDTSAEKDAFVPGFDDEPADHDGAPSGATEDNEKG